MTAKADPTKSVRKGEVASIDSVDVVDVSTIKINVKRPGAALLATLSIALAPAGEKMR